MTDHCHPQPKKDWLFWGSFTLLAPAYLAGLIHPAGLNAFEPLMHFCHSIFELMNKMWWGLALGIVFVGLLNKVPRDFVMAMFGRGNGISGILRATAAGLALDLCSHGILLIGMKLYERGASLGQTMAFLIASPWNSLSLTFILIALVGLKWTLIFILFSAVIAIISGLIFESLVARKILPANPNSEPPKEGFKFWAEFRRQIKLVQWNKSFFFSTIKDGALESRVIVRWLLFGVILASVIRVVLDVDDFQNYFGPTAFGLALTLIAATIIEVCSEGSTPIAADIVTRAQAPGNGFAFLMTGVSTDYTEILAIKEGTRSWKIALFLPLITVPQVVFIAWLMNHLR